MRNAFRKTRCGVFCSVHTAHVYNNNIYDDNILFCIPVYNNNNNMRTRIFIFIFCIETNYIFLKVCSRSARGNQPRGKLRLKSIPREIENNIPDTTSPFA